MSELGKVCEHGSLARQCRICELESELSKAKECLADTPTHADMDAAAFRINMLEGELAKAKEQAERYRIVLERISKSDDHSSMCQLDVHNCVVSCNIRRAREGTLALNPEGAGEGNA